MSHSHRITATTISALWTSILIVGYRSKHLTCSLGTLLTEGNRSRQGARVVTLITYHLSLGCYLRTNSWRRHSICFQGYFGRVLIFLLYLAARWATETVSFAKTYPRPESGDFMSRQPRLEENPFYGKLERHGGLYAGKATKCV